MHRFAQSIHTGQAARIACVVFLVKSDPRGAEFITHKAAGECVCDREGVPIDLFDAAFLVAKPEGDPRPRMGHDAGSSRANGKKSGLVVDPAVMDFGITIERAIAEMAVKSRIVVEERSNGAAEARGKCLRVGGGKRVGEVETTEGGVGGVGGGHVFSIAGEGGFSRPMRPCC